MRKHSKSTTKVLLQGHFDRGYCGTIDIFLAEPGNNRILFGAYENAFYVPNIEPFQRRGASTYIPVKTLETLRTSDCGKFRYAIKCYGYKTGANCFPRVSGNPEIEALPDVFDSDNLPQISKQLGTLLELSGVPRHNINDIRIKIFDVIGFDANQIVPYDGADDVRLFNCYMQKYQKPFSELIDWAVCLSRDREVNPNGNSPEQIRSLILRRYDTLTEEDIIRDLSYARVKEIRQTIANSFAPAI